jgi:serine/threonine protein kinase
VDAVARFGRYELLSPLARGGMGEVYLARAHGPERVHKTVVVKRMRPERASDDMARARFAEEARVAMSLAHPHIVPVFEFGEIEGEYFLIMEWLRGGDLGGVAGVDRTPLAWSACALVGVQVCDALAYVHARANRAGSGLVHGDLTPRNILLSLDGHALLADFGLARFAGQGRAGTPRYLAPEQARGEPFDARADLYALALVLAEAATGQPVLDRDPERAAQAARIGVVPDLGDIDAGLAAVLRRALSARREGRFPDASTMRAALDALLDREPGARASARARLMERVATVGRPPEPRGDSTAATRTASRAPVARPRRRRLLLAALALLLVGGAALWWPLRAARRRPVVTAPTSAEPASRPTTAATAATPATAATRASSELTGTEALPARRPQPRLHRHDAPPALAPAELDLNAQPWAHVRIDGVDRGETPLLSLALTPGAHTLELANEPLGVRRVLTLILRPGEHLRRIEDLTR